MQHEGDVAVTQVLFLVNEVSAQTGADMCRTSAQTGAETGTGQVLDRCRSIGIVM